MEENKQISIYVDLVKELMRQNRKQLKEMKIICLSCIITTAIIISCLVGGTLYFFSTFAVEVEDTVTYEQQSDGNSSIINGDQYRDNSTNNSN